MKRSEIVSIARSYIGTPFHHQARIKGVGIDCVGLLVCVMKECDLQVEDQANYNGLIDGDLLRSKLDGHLAEVPVVEALPGDVFLLRIGKTPQHVAIVSPAYGVQSAVSSFPNFCIIHTHQNAGKVVETGLSGWEKRIVSAYRFPGVSV